MLIMNTISCTIGDKRSNIPSTSSKVNNKLSASLTCIVEIKLLKANLKMLFEAHKASYMEFDWTFSIGTIELINRNVDPIRR